MRRTHKVKGYTVKIRRRGDVYKVHAVRPCGTTFHHHTQTTELGAAFRAYRTVQQIEKGALR